MNLSTFKQDIRQILTKDQEEALELTLQSIKSESKIYKEFINLLGSYSYIKKSLNRGVISHETASQDMNRIRVATLDLLDQVEEKDLIQKEQHLQTSNLKTGGTGLRKSIMVPESLLNESFESQKFIIAVSPLSFQRALGRSKGFSRIYGTYSDFVGVRGILQTFGLLFGFDTLPEIIDPEDYLDLVLEKTPINIFCIASPKANKWTGLLMRALHQYWKPHFEFLPDLNSRNLKNVKISLFENGNLKYPEGWDHARKGDRYKQDYGIIIRGPNPFFPNKMITILSGRSSLGTEAACKAFTNPKILERIKDKLEFDGVDIEDHRKAFRVLVSMKRYSDDRFPEAIETSLKIEECKALLKIDY